VRAEVISPAIRNGPKGNTLNLDLKKTLCAAADKLRSSMDAAEYKPLVMSFIFLE
jgi:type I restriction-modification system DNA methylase subunit